MIIDQVSLNFAQLKLLNGESNRNLSQQRWQTQIEVKFGGETIWLSQRQMSDLFGKDTDTIGLHLKNIFGEEELEEVATTEDFSVVQQEGKRK